MQLGVTILALLCFGSFGWSIRGFFLDCGGAQKTMKALQAFAPRDDQINLAEWNRFEQELDAARRQTAEFEWSLRRSGDRESWALDVLPPLQAELDALEQRWNQAR